MATAHWFEEVADTLGESYLKYSFTRGTKQEVSALIAMLEIGDGSRKPKTEQARRQQQTGSHGNFARLALDSGTTLH